MVDRAAAGGVVISVSEDKFMEPDTVPGPTAYSKTGAGPEDQTRRPDVTFVCCVEHGYFADQFVRFVSSLRQWGGAFEDCPVIAATPRFDPPVSEPMQRRMAELNVRYVRSPRWRRHGWYPYITKPAALELAEELTEADIIVFIDNDVLVSREPTAFALAEEVDLAAAPASAHGGSTGPGHRHEPLWEAMCKAVGVPVDSLPWIDTDLDRQRVRLYFNAGVFAYRPQTGFRDVYESCIHRILDARIQCRDWGTQLLEQAAFGLAVASSGIRYEPLPASHNYHFGPGLDTFYDVEAIAEARILHYHGSMKKDYLPTFLETIREHHPHVHDWLEELGPLARTKSFRNPADLYSLGLRGWRRFRREWFERVASTPL